MSKYLLIACLDQPIISGHSHGNLASMASKGIQSNPKKAALEWLNKVTSVANLGAVQLILPPQPRPLVKHQNNCNWQQLTSAFIWMANAGHFIPSSDTYHSRHQFIPANMNQTRHRRHEHYFNRFWIKKLLNHTPTTIQSKLNNDDEGAANAIRLWGKNAALNLFIYGHKSTTFPSRQSKDSINELIHKAGIKNAIQLEQTKEAIDHGVFHNDVISFGFHNQLICHEHAFIDQEHQLKSISDRYFKLNRSMLNITEVSTKDLSLQDCIDSYLFNSQVIIKKNKTILLCPIDVKKNKSSLIIVNSWLKKGLFNEIKFSNIQSSLMNGGGPACLRLCIYLDPNELNAIPKQFYLTNELISKLNKIINQIYPETIRLQDIQTNPKQYREITQSICQLFA